MISTGFEKITALGFACYDPKIVARYAEPFARKGGGCFTPDGAFDCFTPESAFDVVDPVTSSVVVSTDTSTVAPSVTELTPSGVGSAGFALATVAEDDEEPS